MVQLTLATPTIVNVESAENAVTPDDESVEGVMKGDTAPALCTSALLVPLEAVMFGVANAGEAITTSADTSTSATSAMPLKLFMLNILSPRDQSGVTRACILFHPKGKSWFLGCLEILLPGGTRSHEYDLLDARVGRPEKSI